MQLLQLTLDTLAENLALDEALLDAAEQDEIEQNVLRLWEPKQYGIVLGRSSEADVEVDLAACRSDGLPILRRSSGGGTVVTGPGCLMYAVVLSLRQHPQLQAIDVAHEFVLDQLATMLTSDTKRISRAGTSDLAMCVRGDDTLYKFSGNALRVKRKHLLYHGTLLYDFQLGKVPRWLATPTRTPDYRSQRSHGDFVTNLPIDRKTLTDSLVRGWQADESMTDWPHVRVSTLVQSKYRDDPKWVIHQPEP